MKTRIYAAPAVKGLNLCEVFYFQESAVPSVNNGPY